MRVRRAGGIRYILLKPSLDEEEEDEKGSGEDRGPETGTEEDEESGKETE
jgi:hypothetical protein